MSSNVPPASWPRVQSVPHYTSGPHVWAIVWNGRVNVWECQACGAVPASLMEVRNNCPEWMSRP